MKKTLLFIVASIALVSCAGTLDQPETSEAKSYSVTLNAGKAGTKALAEAGSSLTATWTAGDQVSVEAGGSVVGTLTADADGASTTLSGTITGSFSVGDNLELKYLSNDYTSQNGTLAGIASSCDYATATVSISAVSGDNLTTSDASFENQQAITKFSLFKEDGTTPIRTRDIIITAAGLEGNKISVSAESSLEEVYIAMANISGVKKEYLFIITEYSSGTIYYATKKVNLVSGNYYETALVAKGTVSGTMDLSTRSYVAYTVPNNYLVYDSNPTVNRNIPLTVNNGINLILFNVRVVTTATGVSAMTCAGSATISLLGDNYLKGTSGGTNMSSLGSAGIDAQGSHELYTVTFTGPGNLEAVGGYGAAGIGASAVSGSSGKVHANLVFNGTGTISASSKQYGAGIGSGVMYNSKTSSTLSNSIGNITINSGTIVATSSAGIIYSNSGGAGIGAGAGYGSSTIQKAQSTCGIITINGGNVTATGGYEAAGIGAGACGNTGSYSKCGNIVINGGTVIATGSSYAPGIGAPKGYSTTYTATCGTVTIGSGITSLTATRGRSDYPQCIGVGRSSYASCGDITIDAGLSDSGEPEGTGLVRTISH